MNEYTKQLDTLYKPLLLSQTERDIKIEIQKCTHIIEYPLEPTGHSDLTYLTNLRNIEMCEAMRFGWETLLKNLNEDKESLLQKELGEIFQYFNSAFDKIVDEFYAPYKDYLNTPAANNFYYCKEDFDSFCIFLQGMERWNNDGYSFAVNRVLDETNEKLFKDKASQL